MAFSMSRCDIVGLSHVRIRITGIRHVLVYGHTHEVQCRLLIELMSPD